MKYFDAHIHLEQYNEDEIQSFVHDPNLVGMLAVSMDLASSKRTLNIKQRYPNKVYAACGFHPEQPATDLSNLIDWIDDHQDQIDAIGEIGLPHYTQQDQTSHEELFRQMISLAKELNKPVVLHAVYEGARCALNWIKHYEIKKAHFHWIKADENTLQELAKEGYYVSFAPDLLYKDKTAQIAKDYPLSLILVETDGPWTFEGPFLGKRTTPNMIPAVITRIAQLKKRDPNDVERILLTNIQEFLQK